MLYLLWDRKWGLNRLYKNVYTHTHTHISKCVCVYIYISTLWFEISGPHTPFSSKLSKKINFPPVFSKKITFSYITTIQLIKSENLMLIQHLTHPPYSNFVNLPNNIFSLYFLPFSGHNAINIYSLLFSLVTFRYNVWALVYVSWPWCSLKSTNKLYSNGLQFESSKDSSWLDSDCVFSTGISQKWCFVLFHV